MINVFFRAPEIDISELESLFSAASASEVGGNKGGVRRGPNINKLEKLQLVSYYSFRASSVFQNCFEPLLCNLRV